MYFEQFDQVFIGQIVVMMGFVECVVYLFFVDVVLFVQMLFFMQMNCVVVVGFVFGVVVFVGSVGMFFEVVGGFWGESDVEGVVEMYFVVVLGFCGYEVIFLMMWLCFL